MAVETSILLEKPFFRIAIEVTQERKQTVNLHES